MIGRLLEALPDHIGNPLLKRETVRLLLLFWARHGADWMPFQEQLERFIRVHAQFHYDSRTARKILSALVDAGVVHRVLVPARTVQYRLDRRFADPTWPGFAREVDDLLVDPVPWPTADGRFFKVGIRRPDDRDPWLYMVPTRPHYFAVHAWVRCWIHALNFGFFHADPDDALRVVKEASREASLEAVAMVYRHSGDRPDLDMARRAIEAWRLFPETSNILSTPWNVGASRRGKASAAYAEEALDLLHRLCGHAKKPAPYPRGGRRPKHPWRLLEGRLLRERAVYEAIDRAAFARVYRRYVALPTPFPEKQADFTRRMAEAYLGPSYVEEPGHPDIFRLLEPPLGLLVPHIRALDRRVRASMSEHVHAWPATVPAPAW